MADTNKKEYTSNLHPKGDMDTTVYPNVKSENIIDKDTTAYTAGKVPDSSLVSKSLDGLNEKIETNKIQTDTNKTNIATLQGDVSSLKQDNQTTKTNIATLQSNYTEVQSQANTNSSDIALLETNAVKKDTDASLKSLTLPSASDLKTKDGSTFGGSNELNSFFDLHSKEEPNSNVLYGKYDTYKDIIDIGNKSYIFETNYFRTRVGFDYGGTSFGIVVEDKDDRRKYCSIGKNSIWASNGPNDRLIMNNNGFVKNGYRINVRAKAGDMALLSDLDAKQDKRFVHTVEIHYASNGSYFCFTGISDKNTPIDSVEDLTTVFANRDFAGTGIYGSAGLSKIHVGSSVNDTTFKKYMNNGEYTNPSEETFATVFNPTGFTITDSVSAL